MQFKKLTTAVLLAVSVCTTSALAMDRPVTIADQGSFFAGGSVVQNEG